MMWYRNSALFINLTVVSIKSLTCKSQAHVKSNSCGVLIAFYSDENVSLKNV